MGVESRYGLKFGYMDHGPRNLITDVPGVRVGHVTLHDGEVHTGVTAIIPHTGDVFHEKCLAGAHVINGFGKSIGLVQVQELGTLETPILLTNTLSVGTVSTALVEYMLERNDDIGLDAGTVNSLVTREFTVPAVPALWRDLYRRRPGHDQFRHPPGSQGRGGLCR